ncbi:MAG TPA: CDP-diacylglycerol--serine O-phosphatidyltransferase, partial [Candidatus Berkiella sp.]|nr:CDP-diacylglycerol--serine O-phosphatidyltransferase [Candidatus Berkiella sp.]
GHQLWVICAIVTLITGALMVSNIGYYSFKELDLKAHVPFVAVLAVLLIIVFVSIDPPFVLLSAFALYVLSGPVLSIKRRIGVWRRNRKGKDNHG